MCLTKLEDVTRQRTIGYKLMLKDKDGNLRFIITGEKVSLGEDLVATEVQLACKDGTPYRGGFHYLDEYGREVIEYDATKYERPMKTSIKSSREGRYNMKPFDFDISECEFVMAICEVSDTHTQGGFWDDEMKGYVCSKLRVLSYEKVSTPYQDKREILKKKGATYAV